MDGLKIYLILHGKKSFVIPTKSCVKIGITKIFYYNNKMIDPSTKRWVAAAKFLVAATKILFVVPNFVAGTKPFFSVCEPLHGAITRLCFYRAYFVIFP